MDNKHKFEPIKVIKNEQTGTPEPANPKELPQEIVKQIERKVLDIKRAYSIACLVAPDEELQAYRKWAYYGAITTNTYYNSIIEGKDKEIERLNYIVNLFRLANGLPTKQHGTTQDDLIIANQKAEIERITKLLQNAYVTKEALKYMKSNNSSKLEAYGHGENLWNIYKKEHNIEINKNAADLPEQDN